MLAVVGELSKGWAWDRRWQTLARLMQDGEVIGEAALHNGVWTGRCRGRIILWSLARGPVTSLELVMAHVEEAARRME